MKKNVLREKLKKEREEKIEKKDFNKKAKINKKIRKRESEE